ncbi:MAG: tyrosine-type recombinase/integrase [Thermoleophilia bacterium]
METALKVSPALPDLIEDYLAACSARNLSINSVKLYRIALLRFADFYPGDLDVIDARLLRRYIFELQSQGLSSATVHHYFRAVHTFLGFLLEEGVLAVNPAQGLQMPKINRRLPEVLSEAQSQALLDACPDWTWTGRRDKAAIFLLLGSGLRLHEMLSLNLYDLDLDGGFLRVVGKGRKERNVPIEDNLIETMCFWIELRRKVLNGRPQDALFISRSGSRMGKTFGQAISRAAGKAGFHCTPHVLRHTFATEMLRNGSDVKYVKDILGHSNIAITEIYLHLSGGDLKEAVDRYSITRRLRFDSRQMQFETGG